MTSAKYIKITLVTTFVLMLGIAITVIAIDPFFHYHTPLKAFPYQIDNQLSQNPGMARHMEYDSVLLGSSMTVNFESDLFGELLGLNLIKLPYNGAYPRDIRNIMAQVDRRTGRDERPLKKVFVGIDLASYSGGVDEIKYPLPEYLYDDNPLTDVKYIFNKDVIIDYCLKPVVEWEKTDLSDVYSSEQELRDCYSRDYVLSRYNVPERVSAYFPDDLFIPQLKANLDENIIPIIESHPDTEFVFFFPPYSILYWYEYLQYSQMDAVLKAYEYTMERLLSHDNTQLFFFQGEGEMADIVTDLDLYADTGHYKQDVNRLMTQCFKSGAYRVDRDNYKKALKSFETLVKTYDYEALLASKD